ncbi:MAG: LysR family transcriptional regulator [Clostridia bacterium]|nr:LysR family transcriptional regulator [Clostridia bacterium]
MQARFKVWLQGEKPLFGDGMAKLLEAIDELGSINQAAARLKMSYRQAWGRIKESEERLGVKLLDTKVGGESGGGARLTGEARVLLQKYCLLRQKVEEAVHEAFRQVFGEQK